MSGRRIVLIVIAALVVVGAGVFAWIASVAAGLGSPMTSIDRSVI